MERIFCAALSVALTTSLMVQFKASHPPSAATTLIVSLGILKTPKELAIIMAAVLLLTVEAFVLNRLFRKDVVYPVWSAKDPSENPRTNTSPKPKSMEVPCRNNVEVSGSSTVVGAQNSGLIMENHIGIKQLTLDNFFYWFRLYKEKEDDQQMLRFAQQHKDLLSSLDGYEKVIPYTTRIAIENNLITSTPSENVRISTSGV